MDINAIVNFLIGKWPVVGVILQVLGALVVVGYTYVKISPSPKDNELILKLEGIPIVGQILKVLISFSPIQRKQD